MRHFGQSSNQFGVRGPFLSGGVKNDWTALYYLVKSRWEKSSHQLYYLVNSTWDVLSQISFLQESQTSLGYSRMSCMCEDNDTSTIIVSRIGMYCKRSELEIRVRMAVLCTRIRVLSLVTLIPYGFWKGTFSGTRIRDQSLRSELRSEWQAVLFCEAPQFFGHFYKDPKI